MTQPPSHIAQEARTEYSPTVNPLSKFVNLTQTPEERRDKYAFCREYGLPWQLAIRLRDWHWTKINLFVPAWLSTQDPTLLINRPCGSPSATA